MGVGGKGGWVTLKGVLILKNVLRDKATDYVATYNSHMADIKIYIVNLLLMHVVAICCLLCMHDICDHDQI